MTPFSFPRSVIALSLLLLGAAARVAEGQSAAITPNPLVILVRSGEAIGTPITLSNPTGSQVNWRLMALDASSRPATLEGQLDAIVNSGNALNGPLPLRFDFAGGDTGTSLIGNPTGTTGILSQGNRLLTNLGGPLAYTNTTVAASTVLGPQGRYFTRKLPGLFVFGAETDGVGWFEVAGSLTFGNSKQSASFRVLHNGRWWSAFVVNHVDYWKTINHLVLVDQEGLQQTLGSNTSQQQRITGLSGKRRVYQFLYITTSTAVQPQSVFESLASRFLGLLPEFGSRLTFDPSEGSSPASVLAASNARFNAVGLSQGTYLGSVRAQTQSGSTLATAPVTVNVTQPRIALPTPVEKEMLPGQVALTVELPLTSNLSEAQPWTAELAASAAWATLENSSGTTPEPLRLRLDPAGLASGLYSSMVTVRSGPATYQIPVSLRIRELAVSKFVADPARPWVYAIHKNGLNEGTLLVINSINRRILQAIPTGKEPTDCDVSEDGSKVWVINSKGPSLTAVSTTTWQVIETIPLTGFSIRDRASTEPGAHIKCGKGAMVYYVDEQWGPRLRVFDTATRTLLQTFSSESGTSPDTSNNFGYGDIGLNPQRTQLFGWRQYGDGAGVGGSHIVRFDIKADGTLEKFTKSANYNSTNFDRAPYETPVLFSRDGSRLIIKDRVVDESNLDLHPIVYPDEIFSVSPGGEVAVGSTAIYAGDGGEILHNLAVPSTVQTVLPDYSALVYFNATAKSLGWLDLPATVGVARLALELTPGEGSTVAQPSRLKWLPVTGITRYQVYLGSSRSEVENATTSSAIYLGLSNGNEMALSGGLAVGQTYHWRVVPVDAAGVPVGGSTVYSFIVSSMTFSRSSIAAETVQGVTTHVETIELGSIVPQAWTATETTPWIKSVSAAGTTPGILTVVMDASGLAAGLYQGTVTVTSAGSQVVVPISLRVHAANLVFAEADLNLPYVYLVSQSDVSSTQPSFLLRLNTATDKIESAVPCGAGVTDLAVHYLENRIYLTNWKTGLLRAYDRTTLAQVRTYQFAPAGATGYGNADAYVVAAGKSGRIMVEEQDQWIDSWLVDTATGNKLATFYAREGGGVFDPTGRYYYHGENNSSGAVISKYDTNGDKITSVTSKRVESYSYYGSRLVAMSGDGSRVFWNGGVFDPDLNVLMQLNEEVITSTYRGELVFTNTRAVNGSNNQVLAILPLDTKVQAVSSDQRKLFLFKSAAVSVVNIASIATVPPRGLVPGIGDKMVVIGTSQELTWSQEAAALSYDVYFGSSAAAVAAATKGSPEFLGNVTGTRWTGALPDLSLGGEYFWRVDINGFSSVTKGNSWSFGVASVDVAPRAVKLAAPAGSPVPTQSLAMSAGATTPWTASTGTSWITLRSTSGTTPGSLRFDINTTGLTIGTKNGSITLQAAGKSFIVPVELSIVTLNVTKLITHPNRPVVYAINTSLVGEGFCHLLEINPATATIQRTLPIGFAPTDADLDAVGERLYISNWGYSQTRVIDVAAWAELPSLSLGEDIYKLEVTPKGRLVTEGEDQWIQLDIWNAASGKNLTSSSTPYISVREGDGQADPTGNFYYHCDNNSSGATLQKYNIAADTFVQAVVGPQIGYGSRNLILSGDGKRLFWLGRAFDENLNTLASMPSSAEVRATNHTGDLAIGESAVWWSDSGTQLATLPFTSTIAAFSANDTHLIRFNATTRTLHSTPVSSLTDLPGAKPRPGQVLETSPTRFTWTPVAEATLYRIYIAADASALQAMSSPTATVTSTEYLPGMSLDFGRFYSWRVDAVTTAGVVTGKVSSFSIVFPAGPAVPQIGTGSTGIAASLSDRHLLVGSNGSAQLYNFDPADGRASTIQSFTLPGYYGDHYFGSAVAMDAGKASVGAYAQSNAYVFRPGSAGYWESRGPLSAPTPVPGEGYGYGLAASGNLMLAGTLGGYSTIGRVCAYVTEPGATLTQTFKASDGVTNDGFGRAIVMEGNLAVIAAPGNGASYNRVPCLYAFSRSTSTGLWTQTQKISISGAATSDTSGRVLALAGGTLATNSGNTAIVLYTRNLSGQWVQSSTINRTAIANSSTSFGSGLAFGGDQLFVADPSASNNGASGGAVFSFRRKGSAWIAGPVIAPSTSGASFGGALSVCDHWLTAAGGGSQPAWVFRIGSTENRKPRFTSGIPTQLVAGRSFSIPVLTEDPDGNSGLVIDKLQGPSWLSIVDSGNGQAILNGTPLNAAGTTQSIQLSVRDASGSEAYQTCIVSLLASTDLPVLASSPLDTRLGVGQELLLHASASGIGPFQWQWFKDGKAIIGETGSTYVVSEVISGSAGRYHVAVSNVVGTLESVPVEVTVRVADRYAGDWPTFGGSPAHTGRHPAALVGCQFMPAWNAEVQGGYILNRAAISNGRAVVVPQSRFATSISVRALDLKTGGSLWTFPAPSSNSTNPPSIYQDKVYFQRGKGTGSGDSPQLYSLNAANGQQLWASTFGAQWESYEAPAVSDAGIYVNGGTYGGLYGFNFNGSQRFYQSLPQYDRWTPTLANGRVFSWVGGGTGAAFTEHNTADGTALWAVQPGSGQNAYSMNTVPAVSGSSAAIITTTELICVDLPSRSIRWRVAATHRGSPGIADGRVFAIQGTAVRSYALADGSPGLVYQTTTGTGSSDSLVDQPMLFNDRLVISSEARTWIFNLEDGALLQTLNVGGRLSYSEGYLLAAGNDGVMRAFIALDTKSTLASLKLSSGAFLPGFSSLTTHYIATVPFETESVTLTPTTQYPAATVKINGVSEANGSASRQLSLNVGENELRTLVTAEDGITTMTYTIVVTRLPQDFVFNSAADVPLTANGFSTEGFPVNILLNYPPVPGTTLTMVNNTGLDFIHGRFSNLAQGQRVWLSYDGKLYPFVANYHGGTGNDLVLQWAGTKVSSWGLNNYGQLGDGSNAQRLKPMTADHAGVLADKTIFAISTGSLHSVALCSDGTLASWGYNVQGQLGDNNSSNKMVPVMVDTSGVLAGKTVVAISSGSYHNLALCSDGTVAAWGFNNHGQLGDGTKTTARVPVLVRTDGILTGKQVVAVAAGAYQSYALCSDGTLAAWGYNDEGQLGNGTSIGSTVPVAVDQGGALAGRTVARIAAGQYHALALCTDGSLVSWGYNQRGQLGNSNTTESKSPVAIHSSGALSGRTVTAIGAGTSHSIALCADGTLAAWGYNSQSQLGVAGITQSTKPIVVPPTVNATVRTIHALTVGAHHNLQRFADGRMAAWGGNTNGQLGTRNTKTSAPSVNVDTSALANGGFIMFAASGSASSHNLAVFAVALDPPVGVEAWRYKNFSPLQAASAITGDCADCDHDGIPNLVEYAFGLDPHQNSAGQVPRPELVGNRLELRFSSAELATDVEYGADWSPDLSPGSWREVTDSGIGGEHLFSLPMDGAPNRFMRLRVKPKGDLQD